jgi:transposase
VSAVGINGGTVTLVAQRHEVTRQQIYAWRRELKRKGLWSPEAGALFLPAGMEPVMGLAVVQPPTAAAAVGAADWVELCLAKGRVLRFESSIDDAGLTRLTCARSASG